MSRSLSLQVYVSHDLGARVREVARTNGMNVSEWLRSLIARSCDSGAIIQTSDQSIERLARQSVFVMVGVDALLAGHSDPRLRERAHLAYARKCKELGLAPTAVEGGEA